MKRTIYLLVLGSLFSLTACQPEGQLSPAIASDKVTTGAARVAATRTPTSIEMFKATELATAILNNRTVNKVQTDQTLSNYAFSMAMHYVYNTPSASNEPYDYQGFLLLDTRMIEYRDAKTGSQVVMKWLTNFYNFQTLLNPKFTKFGVAFLDLGDGYGIWVAGFQGGSKSKLSSPTLSLPAIPASAYSALTGDIQADMLQLINKLRTSGCTCSDGKFYPSVQRLNENSLMRNAAEENSKSLEAKLVSGVNTSELPAISSFGYTVSEQKASSVALTINSTASTAGPMSKAEINYRTFTKWKELACPQMMNAEYENLGVGNSDEGSLPFTGYLAKSRLSPNRYTHY
ncbi:hypothetical protein GCM10028805_65120 [Spirosoma harenae]